jgi:hypothetical protein
MNTRPRKRTKAELQAALKEQQRKQDLRAAKTRAKIAVMDATDAFNKLKGQR